MAKEYRDKTIFSGAPSGYVLLALRVLIRSLSGFFVAIKASPSVESNSKFC
jgi:hypothetical protein